MLVLRGISYLGVASNDYFFVIPTSCRWIGFEGTDLAALAHLEYPTVCHGHPVQSFSVPPLSSKLGRGISEKSCGERGIRTPETLLEFTRFPGVPLQPLEHLSFALATSNLLHFRAQYT